MEEKNQYVRQVAEQKYEFGFTTDVHTEIIEKGLNEDVVRLISAKKGEPEWMLEFRLKAFRYWKEQAYTSKPADKLPQYIRKGTLDEVLTESDILSLHCPLTPDTQHLINSQTLQKMKPSAILINTGRGPLVNDQDVADALNHHRLQAFCADVLTEEPPKADNPLLGCENAYITPHIAWASSEARVRLLDVAISNVRAFVEGKPQNVVS